MINQLIEITGKGGGPEGRMLALGRGFTRQTENSKRAHFRHPKIQRKDPHEREERKKIVAGDEKKKREILGPPPFGALTFSGFGPPPFGAHGL